MIFRLFTVSILAIITGLAYGYAQAAAPKTFSWDIPATRSDGTPLAQADLAGYRLYNGASPDKMTVWHTVTGGDQSQVELVINPGENHVAVTAVDTEGNESAYSNIVRVIGLAPPGVSVLRITSSGFVLENVTVTIDAAEAP